MSTTLAFVVGAQVAFAVVIGTVGVRLLRLAARTKCAPELALGVGFLALLVAVPLLGLAGIERGPVADLHFPLLAVGLFLLWVAHSSMACFTWQAFRPTEKWSAALTGIISLTSATIVIGSWHGVTTAAPSANALEATAPFGLWIRLPLTLGLIWTGTEAFRQYAMARRRLALGIGDAVVVNRFLLWALVSVFSVLDSVVGTTLQSQGRGPSNDPLAAAVLAIGGAGAGALVYLAFLPPERWLRFVRSRTPV